ncbi:uncharacterized protein LOC133791793 [Humulus lupulus]|uniref:uncharacterized protein LOC133791793 n=1 Tax=Humulus lupulus TaxID=3486 RepID=UPI002B40F6C5|nr:uncharacterized protein LOC133791793 [Humulus lupulus]
MTSLKEVNEKAYDWLMKKNPSEWSKRHFRFHVKCDMLLNNLCESFNSAKLDAREKPIITLLEKIRLWLMSRLCVKRESVSKWVHPVGKRVREVIEKNKHVARHCDGPKTGYQLTGIPCGNVLAAIWSSNLNVMDFVDSAYKKEAFIAQYAGIIKPMPSPDKWPDPGQNPIPPTENVLPGRPKKSRKREPDEPPAPNATKARRVGQLINTKVCCLQPVQRRRMGRPPKKNPAPETIKRKKRRVRQKAREAAQAS